MQHIDVAERDCNGNSHSTDNADQITAQTTQTASSEYRARCGPITDTITTEYYHCLAEYCCRVLLYLHVGTLDASSTHDTGSRHRA